MLSPMPVQVHRATLLSGEQVVVKVQRPGLNRLFEIDLAALRVLAEQLDAQEEGRDFTGIYSECADILMQEIDYIAEGRNANRCARVGRLKSLFVAASGPLCGCTMGGAGICCETCFTMALDQAIPVQQLCCPAWSAAAVAAAGTNQRARLLSLLFPLHTLPGGREWGRR